MMTDEEFKTFIQVWSFHFPESSRRLWDGGDPSKTFRAWYDIVFRDITLAEAKEATVRLQRSGDYTVWKVQETPSIYRQMVAEIRQGAKQAELKNGFDVPVCPICQNSGLVICWDPRSVAAARRLLRQGGDLETIPWVECSLACSCSAGDKTSIFRDRWGNSRDVPRVDETWLIIDPNKSHQRNREILLKWVASYRPRQEFTETF